MQHYTAPVSNKILKDILILSPLVLFSLTLWSKNPGNKISLPCSGEKEFSCAIELPIGLHFNAFSVFLKTISLLFLLNNLTIFLKSNYFPLPISYLPHLEFFINI